jgi:hypothetical protein
MAWAAQLSTASRDLVDLPDETQSNVSSQLAAKDAH